MQFQQTAKCHVDRHSGSARLCEHRRVLLEQRRIKNRNFGFWVPWGLQWEEYMEAFKQCTSPFQCLGVPPMVVQIDEGRLCGR